jgi:chromosome segregation ATPase
MSEEFGDIQREVDKDYEIYIGKRLDELKELFPLAHNKIMDYRKKVGEVGDLEIQIEDFEVDIQTCEKTIADIKENKGSELSAWEEDNVSISTEHIKKVKKEKEACEKRLKFLEESVSQYRNNPSFMETLTEFIEAEHKIIGEARKNAGKIFIPGESGGIN